MRGGTRAMKKHFVVFFILFLTLAVSPYLGPRAELETAEPIFVFPVSLKEIGEEAFSGTNIQIAVFQDRLERIEDRAFEKTEALTDVYLPPFVEYIAEHAFSSLDEMTIHGVEGSYVYYWAMARQIAFVQENIWNDALDFERTKRNIWEHVCQLQWIVFAAIFIALAVSRVDERKILRPQARAEMHPLDYSFP